MKKSLSPEVETRVQQALNQTDWYALYPNATDRITVHRAAREQITVRVLADFATEQARRKAAQAREAAALLARLPNAGGRYGQ